MPPDSLDFPNAGNVFTGYASLRTQNILNKENQARDKLLDHSWENNSSADFIFTHDLSIW